MTRNVPKHVLELWHFETFFHFKLVSKLSRKNIETITLKLDRLIDDDDEWMT